MSYFTFQRIITFLTGVFILYLANLAFKEPSTIFKYVLGPIATLIGIYIVIASLIPYKNTTKGVFEIVMEAFINFIIELIPRFIGYLFKLISNLFH